jgi:peptide-methionine (S)-S-oxide reductase
MKKTTETETATLAGGCFWCTEAVFKRIKGVIDVFPGYTGGNPPAGGASPTYEKVTSGATGHAEAIHITFDPSKITFDTLLDIFFASHDPTTLNRQGNDTGTQYRSSIFYHSDEQKKLALTKIKNLTSLRRFSNSIITEIVPYTAFYKAESYHLNYYDSNRMSPYCQIVIDPKIRKLMENFSGEVKEEYKKTL